MSVLNESIHALMREASERAILPRYRSLAAHEIVIKSEKGALPDVVTIADRDRLSIGFGGVWAAREGQPLADYDEAPVAAHLAGQEVTIEVDLGGPLDRDRAPTVGTHPPRGGELSPATAGRRAGSA